LQFVGSSNIFKSFEGAQLELRQLCPQECRPLGPEGIARGGLLRVPFFSLMAQGLVLKGHGFIRAAQKPKIDGF